MQSDDTQRLRVSKVTHRYPGTDRAALAEIDLIVESGRFHALLGPNGAGKSTLIGLITGLLRRQQGRIAIQGHDIVRSPLPALSQLGVVFQQPTLDLDLTVEQNLRYFAALNGLSRTAANLRIDRELERLGLSDRRRERVRRLNGGHRRRVEIARVLLHEPSLLIFDEATVGLDVPSRQQIVDYVHRLTAEQGMSVLWATHLIDEVEVTDQVSLLQQGRIVGQGGCGELLNQQGVDDLKTLFQKLTGTDDSAREVAL